MLVGSAFHRYGASSDRIEAALNEISKLLNIKADFFSLPTSITASFHIDEDREEAKMERLAPGRVNLSKLTQVHDIITLVLEEKCSIKEGTEKLKAVMSEKPLFKGIYSALSYAVISGAVCILFRGTLYDVFFSYLLGLFVGLVSETVKKERLDSIKDAFLAFVVSVVSLVLLNLKLPVHPQIINISSLIVLIPGLMLTTSIRELASENLTSGTARLTGSFMILLKLSIGVYLGYLIFKNMGLQHLPNTENLPEYGFWITFIAVILASFALTISFQARLKDVWYIIAACLISFYTTKVFSIYLGQVAGVFVAGTIVAALANAFSKATRIPPLVFLLPAVTLLVPGSIGHKALQYLIENDVFSGVNNLVSTFLVGSSLVSGVLFGTSIIKPKSFI